jgi:acyl-CoA synthetase (NDP forming)
MRSDRKKNFDKMFFPESVAIVGISRKSAGLGGQFFLRNLQRAGYPGRIFLINPTAPDINGIPAYPNISALPEAPDLSIVCVPASRVLSVLEECGRKGARNVHILTSGFKELGTEDGSFLEEEIGRLAVKARLNVIGPNCMGPYVPASRLMLWGQIPAAPGSFAFLSQSGTLTQRMSEHAHFMWFGLSKAVSYGNGTVLDSADYLEYLAEDDDTKAIGFYLESVRDGRRFLNLAREINTIKPLILWKGGESVSGAGTVASHTGTLSGDGRIWEGAVRQAGITRAGSLEEVAGAAMAFLRLPPPGGRRIFILSGGGGYGVYYADVCTAMGLEVPSLTGEVQERVAALVPAVGSFARNPVDAWASFYDSDFMGRILDPVFESAFLDMIILDRLIPRMTYAIPEKTGNDPTQAAIDYLLKNRSRKPLVVVVDGGGEDELLAAEAARMRQRFCQAGIPAYPSFPQAARALAHLAAYYEKN